MFYDAFPLIPLAPLRRKRRFAPVLIACVAMLCALALWGEHAFGQSPVLFPSTISTYAGNPGTAATAVGAGKLCNGGGTPGTGNTLPVATDAYNDGCPAAQAIFSSDLRGGTATDPLGNVFVLDSGNSILRKIDARSGLITLVAGGAVTICGNAVDKEGDGCPLSQAGNFNGPRGVGTDAFGNLVVAGYGDNLVHVVCNTVSPLCTSAQVGTMRVGAGCTTTTAAYGSGGAGADGVLANPAGACSTSVAQLNQTRGATSDPFGNIYIADTAAYRWRVVLGPLTYNGVTNPLVAILKLYSGYSNPVAGYIYALTGGLSWTAPSSGAYCSGSSGPKALDAYGDGCPFYQTVHASTSGTYTSVATDANGNFFFYDYSNTSLVRVMYVGGTAVANAIKVNNPTVTSPVVGSVYILAGGGGASTSATTPVLGTQANFGAQVYKLGVDQASGNLYAAYSSSIGLLDMSTGYIRKVAVSGTNCTTSASGAAPNSVGDGCLATAASFAGSNGIGLATDNLGNLYITDYPNGLVRRISAASYATVANGTTYSPTLAAHDVAAAGNSAPTLGPNTDFTVGTPTCVAHTTSDNTVDCTSTVTFTPTQPGLRTAPLAEVPTTGTTTNAALIQAATGTSLVFDPATPTASNTTLSTLASFTGPTSLALDGAGNLYTTATTAGTLSITKVTSGTGTAIDTVVTAPTQVAVDPQGNVYAATGSANIVKLSFNAATGTFTAGTITNSAIANVKAIAVDANENVYVADSTNQVIKFSQTSGQATTLTASALSNPVALALDNSGNVLIADPGAGAVYKLSTAGITSGLPTVVASTSSPVAVAADPAGDVYYLDSSSGSVSMVPVSGATTTVLGGLNSTVNGLAVDGFGNVYITDLAVAGITKLTRNGFAYSFPDVSTTLSGTLTNVGNATATAFNQTDPTDFNLVISPATCNLSASSIPAGTSCTIIGKFTPQTGTSGTVTNVTTLKPAASTFGSFSVTGTAGGSSKTTTTAIGGQTPGSPSYSGSATEVTFTVTVTASPSGNPTGTVNVSIDAGTATGYVLAAGAGNTSTATVTLTGLTAGTHTLSAVYLGSGSYVGSSTTSATSFSIAQVNSAVTWTPGTLSLQYSAPIGTAVLNAVGTYAGSGIAGTYVYTANGVEVHAATYLPIGSYPLSVTFYPTDAVDYASSTTTGGTLTVSQASTTALVGATQNLVAADGTGNYTSVQTALNALPTTGGSIYIKPGTYTGFVTVVKPNVSLYGLGGVPGNVVITNEDGAFSAPFPAGAGPGNNGSSGDQGSSTMVVARGAIASANGGATFTPYNFYGENFTVQNTYNTDSTTTSTNATVGGTCTANQPAQTLQYLYNAGTECNSQALAIWITGDQAVLNNIYSTSQQDTIYAGAVSGSSGYPARQYWFRGKVTGDVDYIFGDAAAVFDHTTIYTTWHGNSATGTETIEAQNKAAQTNGSGDYLSGYVMNSNVFTSQSTGMTSLYLGRPYGHYSTWIMLNSAVDQVNATGYIEFSGDTNLPTSTYAEYNNTPYIDPTTGSLDANGVTYLGTGGNTGSGVTGTRESTSQDPGTSEAANTIKTALTQVEAQQYYPVNFLGTTVPVNPYNNGVTNWNPTTAIATGVNGFVPTGSSATVAASSSVTILMRPQVPGLGAVTNGTYTIPTGTYTLKDGTTTIASGTLDASGAAYLVTSTLAAGTHSLVFTYGGDSNFSGSTSSAFTLTVTGMDTVTMLTVNTPTPTYGTSVSVSTTVSETGGSAIPTGNVLLSVDGGTAQSAALNGSGVASFTLTGLNAGTHTLTAIYQGDSSNTSSTGTGSVTLAKLPLTVTAGSFSRPFETSNPSLTYNITGFTGTDTASNSVTGTAAVSTTAMRNSLAGNYPVSVVQGSLASTNYSFSTFTAGVATVTAPSGGATQVILFPKIPTIPNGSVIPLFARATSSLPVSYSVSGPATISGHTLTVTGTGTITVTASQSGNSTFAAATSVNRSFTAQ